ncbi:hypothetical protein [Microvirga flavescens]|uniref:hypothetical protein n=1 Tax=Microvirga flavescens TaxID=2249811 RepID=UPI001300686F|nr:hypothetical protein [Microvirga flavescens]
MTDQRPDRKAQMQLIVSVADRMAKRMNAQFVANPEKVESFLSHDPYSIEEETRKEAASHEDLDQRRVYAF